MPEGFAAPYVSLPWFALPECDGSGQHAFNRKLTSLSALQYCCKINETIYRVLTQQLIIKTQICTGM